MANNACALRQFLVARYTTPTYKMKPQQPSSHAAQLRLKAENALVKAMFKKPSPAAAGIFYSQAADAYYAQKDLEDALDCCKRGLALEGVDEKIRLFLVKDAARYAQMLDKPEANILFKQASLEYQKAGKHIEGAQLLFRAAAVEKHPEQARELVENARDILRVENKEAHVGLHLLEVIEAQCDAGEFGNALQLISLGRELLYNRKAEEYRLDKLCLYGIVLCAHISDGVKMAEFGEYFADFNGNLALFGAGLIEVVKDGDQDALTALRNKYLEKLRLPVALTKICRELQVGDGVENAL